MFISDFNSSDYQSLLPEPFVTAINYVKAQDLVNMDLGKYTIPGFAEEDAFFVVMEYDTNVESPVGPEFHKTYCDVQLIVEGEERFGWAEVTDEQYEQLAKEFSYDSEKDICFTPVNAVDMSYQNMRFDEFYLFSPKTVHMPGLAVSSPGLVRKIVIKIKQP
ncbi:YhcH/YjgK/YiaL family protein [Vibrio quintilis]|uniref:Toxin-antitoxin biofilm protein TabA n=1 Tax=Vibrio quintilis TaxID=1117707 RepID=A0A1M7YRS5_9VIBR|nr:YhcH/YjgK/YiaL family protein [Vibrio quintilis]SHO55322.1 Toxin-antitoxin biofilm protein TabA [Vibrio quintilis]